MKRAPLFSLEKATLHHAAGPLFENLSVELSEGDRVALVGKNGAGKTSLLELLAGRASLSSGRFVTRRGLRMGYVSQFLDAPERALSVRDTVLRALADVDVPMPPTKWVEVLADQYDFPIEWLDVSMGSLSGGWVNRAVLLRELAREPDVLLLDEPTNHMDVEGIVAFEALLAERVTCALLMVCHDVDVLDRVCDVTWFLRDGGIEKVALPCSEARVALARTDLEKEERRKALEKEIDRVRTSAKRLATWAKNSGNEKFSRRAKSMEKRVDRMESGLEDLVKERHGIVALASAGIDAKTLVRMAPRTFATPTGVPLFTAPEFVLRPGDRAVLLGPNGAGKSTFVRAFMQAFRGQEQGYRFNPRLEVGYYDQDLAEVAMGESVFSLIRKASAQHTDQELRKVLVDAGFPYDTHAKPVRVCSGGERSRLLLLTLRLSRPNFLVLDEPTNHLDIFGIEALVADILENETPALVVTHNRAFARAVGTRFFRIVQGVLREVDGLDSGLRGGGVQGADVTYDMPAVVFRQRVAE